MGDIKGGLRSGNKIYRRTSKAIGKLWCSLATISVRIAVVVGIKPMRAIVTSTSENIDVFCRSHHVSSTKTVGVKVPSTASLEKYKIFPFKLYGL